MDKQLTALRRSILLTIAILGLTGCGGRGASSLTPFPPDGPAGAADQPQTPDISQLPELGSLAGHAVSFTELGLMAEGDQFDNTLPSNRTTILGTDVKFTPQPGGVSSSAMAYAIYGFDASGYNRDLNMRLTWTTAPATGTAYLALGNFATGRWEWFPVPADNIVPFATLASYLSPAPNSALYAAVLVTSGTGTLDRLRVGTQPSPGLPTAAMKPSRFSIQPGGQIDFDARASSANAPAAIVSYEFDPDDGSGFLAAADQFTCPFPAAGTFSVRLRVTDTFGAQDTASMTITVGGVAGYDEIEPNSDQAIAQLIQLPVYGWHGNCGPQQAAEPVYDGSENDEFKFTAQAGDRLQVSLELDPSMADLDLLLLDVNGAHLTTSEGVSGTEQFSYTFTDADAGPFCLVVQSFIGAGSSDYLLYATLNAPVTVLTVTPAGGPASLHVTLDASGSTNPGGTIAEYAFDPDGDGTFQVVQASPLLPYDYPLSQVYYPAVAVVGGDGQYTFVTKVVYPDSPYSEVEENDYFQIAQPLPALPFGNFTGNIGFGGAYNHDNIDVFSFTASPGEYVDFSVTPGAGAGPLYVGIVDKDFSLLAHDNGTMVVSYQIQPGDSMPLYLVIQTDADLAGNRDYTLRGAINAPGAKLVASVYSGPNPLITTLTATGIPAPGRTIVGYQFDGDGDGTFSPQQPGNTLLFNYNVDGLFHPVVRVVDSVGATADATVGIYSGQTFDETEDNDTTNTAQNLPTFPFVGFRGSNGSGPGYVGYDGDNVDCFWFSAKSGQRVQFHLTYPNATGELTIDMLDSDGFSVVLSGGSGGEVFVDYVTGVTDGGGPYLVQIYDPNQVHYGDYTLEGHLYSEVEDNDTRPTAQQLPAFPFTGFSGSHFNGTGYPGYDGDSTDNFKFAASAGQTVTFNLTYANTHGELSLDLLDKNGNDVKFVDGAGGTCSLTYVLGSNGIDTGGPYVLQLWDAPATGHYGDYLFGGTLN